MVPAEVVGVPPSIEYALPALMAIGLAVLLLAKPEILTVFEETDAKMGTPNLLVKLNGAGLVADPLNWGNQSTPQPATSRASTIKQIILKSLFSISPVPGADSAI